MKFALVIEGAVREYRDYPTTPECKYIDGKPMLRPAVEAAYPVVDVALYNVTPTVTIFDDRVERGYAVAPVDLATAKSVQRQRINAARDAEEAAGFSYLGKTFDSDEAAIRRIGIAVQAAQVAPDSFTIDWTVADGSTISLTKTDLLTMPAVMAQTANALHVKARSLKAQIDAAASVAAVEGVTW